MLSRMSIVIIRNVIPDGMEPWLEGVEGLFQSPVKSECIVILYKYLKLIKEFRANFRF